MAEHLPSRYWSDLTTEEFSALDRGRLVAVLPVAATEQHGPHLPVSVDADINRAIVGRLVELAPADLPLLIMPAVEIGLSPEHRDFPGTITLSPETMLALLSEIGDSVADSGIRRLGFLNTHGGQPQILDLVCQGLRSRRRMLAAAMNAYRYWDTAGTFDEAEATYGIHGGAAETSIMLHAHADKVRADKLADFASYARAMADRFGALRPYGRTVGLGWQMQDINPQGAAGDASRATAAAGRDLVDQAARQTLRIIEDLAALDPDDFIGAPDGQSS